VTKKVPKEKNYCLRKFSSRFFAYFTGETTVGRIDAAGNRLMRPTS
jgi:hypothetical protein